MEKGGILVFTHPASNAIPLSNVHTPGLEFFAAATSPILEYFMIVVILYHQQRSLNIERFLVLLKDLVFHPSVSGKDIKKTV